MKPILNDKFPITLRRDRISGCFFLWIKTNKTIKITEFRYIFKAGALACKKRHNKFSFSYGFRELFSKTTKKIFLKKKIRILFLKNNKNFIFEKITKIQF